MAEEGQEEQPKSSGRTSMKVDLKDLYKFDSSDLIVEIGAEYYSNVAYIQVASRDVYIDFLPLPGVRRDGKMVIKGARIFMSHPAAQKLADTLQAILKDVHQRGGMETYEPSIKEE